MILTFVFYLCHDMVMITLTNDYLAIERDFAGVEGHQDMVDDHRDVVGGEEEHEENLREKQGGGKCWRQKRSLPKNERSPTRPTFDPQF